MTRIGDLATTPKQLHDKATAILKLSAMFDRAVPKDFKDASDLLGLAAKDIEKLLEARLAGCPCRRIDHDDGRGYLVYSEDCRHHAHLKALADRVEKDYEEAKQKLKDTVWQKAFLAALTGAATVGNSEYNYAVDRAKKIANDAVELMLHQTAGVR